MASVFQRGKVFWILYYENGKKISYSLKTKDKTVAKYRKNEVENKLALGDSPFPHKNTIVADALQVYAAESQNRKITKTIYDDEQRLKAFFTSAGILRLNQIHEHNLEQYIQKRIEDKKINLTTANHTIKTVKAFLNFCVKRKFITTNPVEHMKRFKVEKRAPRYLSKGEIDKILTACRKEAIYPMVVTALYTGMRYGELLNLRDKDVDLKNNAITVQKSKSGRFRIIPIHADLRPLLKTGVLPFQPLANYTALRLLQRITGQKDLGWHTFRHTFASHLVMNGVDIVTVSKLLGHSRLETTMMYSHLSDDHLREAMGKLRI